MRRFIWLGLLLFITGVCIQAQTGTVEGTVSHPEDGPMSFMNITTVDATGTTLGGSTDLDGNYSIILPVGSYELKYSYVGYADQLLPVEVVAGKTIRLDVSMAEEESLLGTVVVTGSKFDQPLGKVTTSMDVLKPTMIENANNVSIDQSLTKVPGVQIIDGQTNIRGGAGFAYGAGSRVAVLVDDLSILTGDNGVANFDFVPVENVGQVEIIKGASSVLYGSAALNGIINVRTAYPKKESKTKVAIFGGYYDNPGGADDTVFIQNPNSVDTITGPRDWWNGGTTIADTLLPESTRPYQTGAYITDSRQVGKLDLVSGIYAFKRKSFRQTEQTEWWRFHVNSRYRLNERTSVGLNVNFQQKQSTSFFIWDGEGPGKYLSWTIVDNPNNDIWRMMIDPFFTYRANNGWSHKVLTRFHRANNTTDTGQSFKSDNYYGEYQIQKRMEDQKMTITAGLVAQAANVVGDLYQFPDQEDPDAAVEIKTSNMGAFIQFDKEFGDRLNTNIGARWERNTMTNDDPESKPVFRAGANYELVKKITFIRASIGQGYRFPTIAERFVQTELGGVLFVDGNPDLTSETGLSAELGVKQGLKLGGWKGFVDVTAFYNRYNRMMEFTFGGESGLEPGFVTINTGDTEIKGFEVGLAGRGSLLGRRTEVLAGYTYINPTFVDFNEQQQARSSVDYNILKYRFKHNAKIDLQTYFSFFSFGFAAQYYSNMDAVDAVFLELIPDLTEYRAANDGGEFILDARIEFNIGDHLKAAFLVNNVLNNAYTIRPAIMEAPRFFQTKLSYEF